VPTHDIIDNRREILVDHINRILSSTEAARFAMGYFFLSGLIRYRHRGGGAEPHNQALLRFAGADLLLYRGLRRGEGMDHTPRY